jgi:hypothetical protein
VKGSFVLTIVLVFISLIHIDILVADTLLIATMCGSQIWAEFGQYFCGIFVYSPNLSVSLFSTFQWGRGEARSQQLTRMLHLSVQLGKAVSHARFKPN